MSSPLSEVETGSHSGGSVVVMESVGTEVPVAGKKKRPRYNLLNSLDDCRRNLARVIRSAERVGRRKPGHERSIEEEKLELERCRAVTTALRALAEMFAGAELERRLKALEEKAQAGAH